MNEKHEQGLFMLPISQNLKQKVMQILNTLSQFYSLL